MKAAKAFFRSAQTTVDFPPNRVTTGGHSSYPRAIRSVLGKAVAHRTSAYLNNRLEQDHRGIKAGPTYARLKELRCRRPVLPRAWLAPKSLSSPPSSQSSPLRVTTPLPLLQSCRARARYHEERMIICEMLGSYRNAGASPVRTDNRVRVNLTLSTTVLAIIGRCSPSDEHAHNPRQRDLAVYQGSCCS